MVQNGTTRFPGSHPRRIDPAKLIGTYPRTSSVAAASQYRGRGCRPPHLLPLKGWFLFHARKSRIAIKMNALFKFYSRIMPIGTYWDDGWPALETLHSHVWVVIYTPNRAFGKITPPFGKCRWKYDFQHKSKSSIYLLVWGITIYFLTHSYTRGSYR